MVLLFEAVSLRFKLDKEFRKLIKNDSSTFNQTIAFSTGDGNDADPIDLHVIFRDGKMEVRRGKPDDADVIIFFKDKNVIESLSKSPASEVFDYLLQGKIHFQGNLSYVLKFAYILNCFKLDNPGKRTLWSRITKSRKTPDARNGSASAPSLTRSLNGDGTQTLHVETATQTKQLRLLTRRGKLEAKPCDNVVALPEPYLRQYGIQDFPELEAQRNVYFSSNHSVLPEICTERANLITDYFLQTGFEHDASGNKRNALLRQALALNYVLSHKEPKIFDDNLLAGSTTSKKVGVVLYPEGHAVTIWPELRNLSEREFQPYQISDDDIALLDRKVFPYWMNKNVREYHRAKYNSPRSQELDEKFVLYFNWKTISISHTIPDFPKLLKDGLASVIDEAKKKEKESGASPDGEKDRIFYQAVQITLAGVLTYADNLKREAERRARESENEEREHYQTLAEILQKVPRSGADTLYEAVQSLWSVWIALHNESTNVALSLGQLDTMLQPYFERDIGKLSTDEEREDYTRLAIRLVGDLLFKCQDHLPLVADVGNKLFCGSSSDQALTIGGADRHNANNVCDMTYIILKAAEMLTIRDPNLNAKYVEGVNSETYLKRLVEVNVVTCATPSLHNGAVVARSLMKHGFAEADAREWVATGCVEPTVPGKHFGNTASILFNLVAPLEMALNNGRHPLIDDQVGPRTGDVLEQSFSSFDEFYRAFEEQLSYLANQAMEYNNSLGLVHQDIRPTPILSALFDGPMEKALDVTEGGAKYNTSGVGCTGLADVVDSLMTIKQVVFDEKRYSFETLHDALEANFEGHEDLHSIIQRRVPKFGSDAPQVNALARKVIGTTHRIFSSRENYRGGKYHVGFWSISIHIAFGNLSGALPSGRLKHQPFTPGLTPNNAKGVELLSSIRTIADLDADKMPNNVAFNVKLSTDPKDSHAQSVDNIAAYVKSYFDRDGMQMQLNIVTTEMLRDAVDNPDDYRNLMVRVSGYSAYFVELTSELQQELINRLQYVA